MTDRRTATDQPSLSTPRSRQAEIDAGNVDFWDELCGSSLAQRLGISDVSRGSLRAFDDAYLDLYPYLSAYYDHEALAGRALLEIGLGYGTLSAQLAARGADYYGLDIAREPVEMVRHRLRLMGRPADDHVAQGSALDIPHADLSFDFLYSIGCLHHSGDLVRAISEVHRVLRHGGRTVVMLYNRHSLRQLLSADVPGRLLRRERHPEELRARYDANAAGHAAPHTDYVSRRAVRTLFADFSRVRIDVRNFDNVRVLPRKLFLGNLDRVLGLDLYVVADK